VTFSVADLPAGPPIAFVANNNFNGTFGDGIVAVVDFSFSIVEEIETSNRERLSDLAITPDGQFLYAPVSGFDQIHVIEVATLSVVETIPTGDGPRGIVITPDGNFAYVSHRNENTVQVLDLSTNTFVQTISSPFFDTPRGIAITPDGSHVYVANVFSELTVIETASNTVVAEVDIPAPFGPWDVTTLPFGQKAYTGGGDNGEFVFEIDTDPSSLTFNQVTAAIRIGENQNGPRGMESGETPLGVRVYAALAESDEVVVIDPATNQIVARVPTGSGSEPRFVRLNPDGTQLWVSLHRDDEVLVFETTNYNEIARIPGFDRPADIVFVGEADSDPGTISGTVSVNGTALENVIIKLLNTDEDPLPDFDDDSTDTNGQYSFADVSAGDYQVMIVEPLGYIIDLNPKPAIVVGNETTTVNFNLTEIVVVNNARSKGYWKHQFDVYVGNRGNAQESEQDLNDYIDLVHQHYTLYYDIFTDIDILEEWQDILSLRGNHPMADRAKQHLSALILNMVSNKIGQYTVVTDDGRDVGDVIQYVSELIIDGDDTNDELAKDLAESVNNQQMIAAGIVPEGSIIFKTGNGTNNIEITTYELFDNYPNPFNPSTKIVYQIPEKGNVSLKVYDMLGKEITTLVEEYRDEGRYEINFDAGNLASGIYIYQ